MNDKFERAFANGRRAAYRKHIKPVTWNGLEFESGSALAKHLKMGDTTNITSYVRLKKPIKGHVPTYNKSTYCNACRKDTPVFKGDCIRCGLSKTSENI